MCEEVKKDRQAERASSACLRRGKVEEDLLNHFIHRDRNFHNLFVSSPMTANRGDNL
jgi:hypothetical protein